MVALVTTDELTGLFELQKDSTEALVAYVTREREFGLRARKIGREFKQKDLPAVLPSDWDKHDSEHLVWHANLYSEIGDDEFARVLRKGKSHPIGFSELTVRKAAQKIRRERIRAERRQRPLNIEDIKNVKTYVANLKEVQTLYRGKAVAVITDPPYNAQALHTWKELTEFADRVLIDHGWLIAVSGQRWLPQVFAELERGAENTDMKYRWTIALHTPGGTTSQGWIGKDNALNVEWKPIIVYSKGDAADWPDQFRDFLVSKNERLIVPPNEPRHPDEQCVDVFRALVNRFTKPKNLVADPFLGGGTTAVAAHQLGRTFEGFDIMKENVAMARQNLKRNQMLPKIED